MPGFPGGGSPGGGFPGMPGFPSAPDFPGGGFPGMPGFPGSVPGTPGGGSPSAPFPGSPGGAQPPSSPPPSYTPQKPFTATGATAQFIDPGSIARCLFRFTYVWLRNGGQFWFFPVFVGPNSVAGFRWEGFRWRYFGIDVRLIDAFTC
ncbi:collagen-like protein [Paenibacillus sp. SYP-B3998]|uniref:Collagen-like protein n=2 Tax=Paenibacillus sp. SYP-B3998 TaxID=2678564 RepID=A0A6G3ZZD5_9BACL|nr:collagen-like protein [Paenibacillus sp. SYP-B3998]